MVANPKFTLNQGTAILPNLPPWLGYPGNIWHVKPYSGDDSYSGKSKRKPCKSVAAALASATDNNNDVVLLHSEEVSGALTSDLLAATLTWNKSVHLVGVNSGVSISPRSRISPVSTYAAAGPTMNVTAGNCYFANLQIIMDVNHATPLGALALTGALRCRFDNCHIYGMVYAAGDTTGAYSLLLSNAEEIEFHDCTVGSDRTVLGANQNSQIKVAATSKNILFKDSRVRLCSVHGTNTLFMRAPAGSLDGNIHFQNTQGINSQSRNVGGAELTYAFLVAADAGGDVTLCPNSAFQATDLNATDAGNVYVCGVANIGGIMVPALKT